jgi:hypothetical protein
MVRRRASNTMPIIWKTNPIMTNLISPSEAMTTPTTMTETLRKTLRFGDDTPSDQLEISTATGMVALSIWRKATLR